MTCRSWRVVGAVAHLFALPAQEVRPVSLGEGAVVEPAAQGAPLSPLSVPDDGMYCLLSSLVGGRWLPARRHQLVKRFPEALPVWIGSRLRGQSDWNRPPRAGECRISLKNPWVIIVSGTQWPGSFEQRKQPVRLGPEGSDAAGHPFDAGSHRARRQADRACGRSRAAQGRDHVHERRVRQIRTPCLGNPGRLAHSRGLETALHGAQVGVMRSSKEGLIKSSQRSTGKFFHHHCVEERRCRSGRSQIWNTTPRSG